MALQAARTDVQARLRALPGVTVVPRDDKLKYRHAHSRIWNETWLAAFFHKPCNHELFVLQSLNMEGTAAVAMPVAIHALCMQRKYRKGVVAQLRRIAAA